jgi:peptidoglycan hydrolase CwlO-like protein
MKKHFYLHGDGNGGLIISKVLATIIMIISVVTPMITVIWFAANVQAQQSYTTAKVDEIKAHEAADDSRFLEIEKSQVEYQTDIKYLTQKVDRIDTKLDKVLDMR